MGAFSPLVQAGPNQYGYSATQDAALRSQAITQGGVEAKNVQQAVGDQFAASGGGAGYMGRAGASGGEVMIPSGARTAEAGRIDTALAENTSNQLLNITNQGYQQGRQNWASAVQGELAAPGLFNPATSAGSAAGTIGQSAFGMQDTLQKERKSSGVMGALGGVLGGIAPALNFIPGIWPALAMGAGLAGGAMGGGGQGAGASDYIT